MQSHAATTPQPAAANSTAQGTRFAAATLLITFGVGRSYLFNVDRKRSRSPKEYWRAIFPNNQDWSFDQFDEYKKPLGESVTFTFNEEAHNSARDAIDGFKDACEAIKGLKE